MPDELLSGSWKDAQTVTITLTTADYFRASYAIANRRPVMWFMYAVFGVLPILTIPIVYLNEADDQFLLSPWIMLCGPVFIFVVTPIISWLKIWSAVSNMPAAQGSQTYRFGEEGMTVGNALGSTEMKWAAFLKVVETASFFLFYFGPKTARFLPKRALPDPDERRELRHLLRAALGDKAYLRSENN